MHKNTTTPLLVHFAESERAKLASGQGEAESAIGKKLSQTLIVKASINMVLDDPKLRRRLMRALKQSSKPPVPSPTVQRASPAQQ